MIDFIMRLFGYENIDNIKIYNDYAKTPPRWKKLETKKWFYEATGKFLSLIVIEKNRTGEWYLIDGYTSYLIAKEKNIKYVKVVRV